MIRCEGRVSRTVGTLIWLVAVSATAVAQDVVSSLVEPNDGSITAAPSRSAPMAAFVDDDTRLRDFDASALARGTPDIPGLNIVWLTPWINPALARDWRNIVVHQSEGAPGSAWRGAVAQMQKPARRGTTIWVETDGTVYWAAAEFAAPNHIRDANRIDNRFVDNRATHMQMSNADTLGIEFVGNYPNVRKRPTDAQIHAWQILLQVLQVRYAIPNARVFAHNWIDYKDRRYCEGCALAEIARLPPPDKTQVLVAKTR